MKINKRRLLRVLTGVLTLGIMILIFLFSAQNGEKSSGTSGRIVHWILENGIEPIFRGNQVCLLWWRENLSFLIRKLAHFSIYATLGMTSAGFLFTFEKERKRQALFAFIFGTFYAITDEVHQLFTTGRSGQVSDVLLDSFGVFVGISFLFFLCYITKRKHEKKNKKVEN